MYEVIDKFGIHVGELEYAAYQTLNSDFNQLKESMEGVETTKDDLVSGFSQQLEADVEVITKEAVGIRNAAMVSIALNPNPQTLNPKP